jgi:hypothetical protein
VRPDFLYVPQRSLGQGLVLCTSVKRQSIRMLRPMCDRYAPVLEPDLDVARGHVQLKRKGFSDIAIRLLGGAEGLLEHLELLTSSALAVFHFIRPV